MSRDAGHSPIGVVY